MAPRTKRVKKQSEIQRVTCKSKFHADLTTEEDRMVRGPKRGTATQLQY